MLKTIGLAAAFVFAATSAMALSCLRPDVINLYSHVKEDPAPFYLVLGQFSLLEPARKPTLGTTPEDRPIAKTAARFSGKALNDKGFVVPLETDVIIEVSCVAMWCGSAEGLNDTYIAALRIDREDDLSLSIGPCGGRMVSASEENKTRLLDCHVNGNCTTRSSQ